MVDCYISLNFRETTTLSRMICSACGTSYNSEVLELSPKNAGFCDKCGIDVVAKATMFILDRQGTLRMKTTNG